jgi:hypothetical protein
VTICIYQLKLCMKKQLTLRSLGLKDGIVYEWRFAFTTNWIMFERTLRRRCSCLVVCLWLSFPRMSGQTLVWTQEHYAVQISNTG